MLNLRRQHPNIQHKPQLIVNKTWEKWILHSQLHIPAQWCGTFAARLIVGIITSTLLLSDSILSLQTAVVIKPPFPHFAICLALMYSLCMFLLHRQNVMAEMGFSLFMSRTERERGKGRKRKWFSIWIAVHTVKLGDISHRLPQSIGDSADPHYTAESLLQRAT